ncbi:putative D-erythronate kinase [uncultured Defluviicoccus sp.]|uniref:Putative D-erythronate kinase n=1 Tax=metagenome TaxID=256318 RepID=A0A380TDM2_9ZZZZ|nr:putative D-erythronate kinase [uncultured Defluviicoccus sp.]
MREERLSPAPRPHTRIAVIADDLSGGMVTGVQFAPLGLRPTVMAAGHTVVRGAERLGHVIPVWDTASRADVPEVAYAKVRTATRAALGLGVNFFYKQADSQLRGNLGAEVKAVIDETGARGVLCCFANPDIGRITVGGQHLANGQRVQFGPAGEDAITPVRESYVPAVLAAQVEYPIVRIDQAVVGLGPAAVVAAIRAALQGTGPVVLAGDAATLKDLVTLAAAAIESGLIAASGSYGLAWGIAEVLKRTGGGGTLVLAGSTTALVRTQVESLSKRPSTCVLLLRPEDALAGRIDWVTTRALTEIQEGRDVAIVSPGDPDSVRAAFELGRKMGLAPKEVHRCIASALGEIAHQVLSHATDGQVQGLIATGGDIACATLHRLAQAVELTDQPIAGAAAGLLSESRIPFIAKSGACGGPDGLGDLLNYLRRRSFISTH